MPDVTASLRLFLERLRRLLDVLVPIKWGLYLLAVSSFYLGWRANDVQLGADEPIMVLDYFGGLLLAVNLGENLRKWQEAREAVSVLEQKGGEHARN